jgi:hypothetical protein
MTDEIIEETIITPTASHSDITTEELTLLIAWLQQKKIDAIEEVDNIIASLQAIVDAR